MKKIAILGAAKGNVIRTIDSINSKKTEEIIVECFIDNDKKKLGHQIMNKKDFRYTNFLKTYSKDDCHLFNSIASSMQDRKDIIE